MCCRSAPPARRRGRPPPRYPTSYLESLAVRILGTRRLRGAAGLVVRRLDAELELDPPDALERALRERSLGVEQIADDAERAEQHRRDEQHRAGDQRLDV